MTLQECVARATDRLVHAGLTKQEATSDAELLARHVLGWDRATYITRHLEPSPTDFNRSFSPLISRRTRREPVSLITEQREFWGITFQMTAGVLTPRPETELIVEASIAHLQHRRKTPLLIADIGTGSGCLAVALATEFSLAMVTAIDISPTAVKLARSNAYSRGLQNQVQVIEIDLSDWLKHQTATYDLVVANLPYIPTAETDNLPPEVKAYEPRCALDGGQDGLYPLRTLLSYAHTCLKPSGNLIVEIGLGQDKELQRITDSSNGLEMDEIRKDLQGIPRTAVIKSTKQR